MAKRNTNFTAMEKYFWENYLGEETELNEACLDVVGTGRDQYNYANNLQRLPHEQDRMADWFQGLPHPFYPTPYYHEIEENLTEWGIIKNGFPPSRVQRLKDGWWTYWAAWVIKNAEGRRL